MRAPVQRRWSTKVATLAGLTALGLTLAACGSSPSASTTSSSAPASTSVPATNTTGTLVGSTTSAKYGTILVTASGKTLYMLTADSPTSSACANACATIWPPLATTAAPRAGTGVKAALLGTLTRSDGSKQVTYNGHPLYTFGGDASAGQTNGERIASFGGTWYVVDTSGNPVTAAASSPAPTSSTSPTGSGAYGY
jgi:predicted lipoprotein with Yx(FWY)xxD motif